MLHRREVIQRDYNRWRNRAKAQMRSSGVLVSRGVRSLKVAMDTHLESCTEGKGGLGHGARVQNTRVELALDPARRKP